MSLAFDHMHMQALVCERHVVEYKIPKGTRSLLSGILLQKATKTFESTFNLISTGLQGEGVIWKDFKWKEHECMLSYSFQLSV